MSVMLDCFSGLGGASEAFVNHPDWCVSRIDNSPLVQDVPHTFNLDIVDTPINDVIITLKGLAGQCGDSIDLMWFSPPCPEFSRAYNAPGPKAARAGEEFSPDMEPLLRSIALRDALEPRFWAIENVMGAIPHFTPLLGVQPTICGSFCIWTNLPSIHLPPGFTHRKQDQDTWSDNPLRSHLLAQLPIELSEAIRTSAESPTLGDF